MVKFNPKSKTKKSASGRKLSDKQKGQVKSLITRTRMLKTHMLSVAISATTTATITNLAAVPTSTQPTIEQREDTRIQIQRFMVRFSIIGADATNIIRVIYFQWKPNNADDAPAIADILELSGGNTLDTYVLLKANRKKFKIISDRLYGTDLTTGPNHFVGKLDFKYSPGGRLIRDQLFNGTALTGKNAIHILVLSDSGAASHPTVTILSALSFYDT